MWSLKTDENLVKPTVFTNFIRVVSSLQTCYLSPNSYFEFYRWIGKSFSATISWENLYSPHSCDLYVWECHHFPLGTVGDVAGFLV